MTEAVAKGRPVVTERAGAYERAGELTAWLGGWKTTIFGFALVSIVIVPTQV